MKRRKIIIIVMLFFFLTQTISCSDQTPLLTNNNKIDKLEIDGSCADVLKFIVLTDPKQLDTINREIKKMFEININTGVEYDFVATLNFYKGNVKIETDVLHSIYMGWAFCVGGRTFKSQYMFDLAKRYIKPDFKGK